ALIKVDPADVGGVNPSVPGFGGPTGVGSPGPSGATVYSYGNSSLRFGARPLRPKQGTLIQTTGGGWSHTVYTVTPGIPGDSGSGFFSSTGAAFGTLSTVAIAPLAGSNGVGDLAKELAYMRTNSSFSGVNLVPGTEPFRADFAGAVQGA
ncbi:MAG TPA: serine protease, partial [Solirubrobacterales bacterium]|nr:serine protease [Solirubrobacterales bacterium]